VYWWSCVVELRWGIRLVLVGAGRLIGGVLV
jgi:hypothetical protein